MFGNLGGGVLPFEEPCSGSVYVFAFRGLPVIVITAALSALLNHWKIIPSLVRGVSIVLQRSMGIGGALGMGSAQHFSGHGRVPAFRASLCRFHAPAANSSP